MTYNFDPDLWLENQRRYLEHRLEVGDIDDEQFARELEEAERRYDEMLERLDGTYELPG